MSDVVAIYRHLIGLDGTKISHLIRLVENEQLAEEFVGHEKEFIQELAKMHVTEVTAHGPRGVATLPALLAELGIANIGTRTVKIPVHASNLVVPRTVVTLQ